MNPGTKQQQQQQHGTGVFCFVFNPGNHSGLELGGSG